LRTIPGSNLLFQGEGMPPAVMLGEDMDLREFRRSAISPSKLRGFCFCQALPLVMTEAKGSGAWNRSHYSEMQGTMDSGALYWLQKAVDYTSKLGEHYAREIWFVHNAHSMGNLTVTTRQMELDLEISKRAGVPHIGWFTLDKIGEGPYHEAKYFGGMAAFDAFARYDSQFRHRPQSTPAYRQASVRKTGMCDKKAKNP